MCECSCWVNYPNPMHKNRNGKWKCVDNYECVNDLEVIETKIGLTAVKRKTHCRKKESISMAKADIKDFENGFEKQLAYFNRTFLRGHYNYGSGAEKFTVVRNGKVWEFDNLPDAVKKYNEVIQYGETEKIPE